MSSDSHYEFLYPASAYHEDYGDVLWWHLPVGDGPYLGPGMGMDERNLDGSRSLCNRLQREGWLTHFSRLPVVWDGDGMPKHPVRETLR
jgi:hypothetical protein